MVGALAGLASNFFFGQGPWTPWQMAAWGATGMIGAGLAWLGSRPRAGRRRRGAGVEAGAEPVGPPRIGRVALALVCGVVGFAFTAVQDVGDWVTYSDHSVGQLRAYVGSGIGFDTIYAVGCVAFALLLGPALLAAIQRFTRRLQVRWVAPGTAFPLLGVGLATLAIGLPGLGSARAARRRLTGRLPPGGAERRWRVRQRTGTAVRSALLRLGGPGAGLGQRRSAAGEPRRAQPDRLHRGSRPGVTGYRFARAHDPRRPGRRPVRAEHRFSRPAGSARASPARQRVIRGDGQPHGVRTPRAAQCRRSRARCEHGLACPPAGWRRRLRLCRGGLDERQRRHGSGA